MREVAVATTADLSKGSAAVGLAARGGWPDALGEGEDAGSPTRAGTRSVAWGDLGRLGAVGAQLAFLALVIHQFEIESNAFFQLALLAFGGFVVHHSLPARHRMLFFLVMSLAGIVMVMGLTAGVSLIILGSMLIGLCHLPVSYWSRVSLVALAGILLAVMRVGWVSAPWSGAIWPILGSMFMFRLLVYLHDLRYDKAPSLACTASYFFLLPNVCFPLFPIIDFKTFRRTYYNEETFQIYQRGVHWMFRGVVQLILYRYVYYYLTIPQSDVASSGDLARHVVSNYLLYLRVSGQFHVIVGMLHLFGFNLPTTNYLYFLASGFNDLWRRMNIYWKDFMVKLFYYPLFLRFRRFGQTWALILSILLVFVCTWLLHSYQWFWLRGSFPLNWQDAIFWTAVGTMMVANSLYESKYGRKRSLVKRRWTVTSLASRSLGTAATFGTMCVLWSLWMSESVSDWLSLWSYATKIDGASMNWLSLALLAGVWLGSKAGESAPQQADPAEVVKASSFGRAAALTCGSILGVYAIGHPVVSAYFGSHMSSVIQSLRSARLNAQDTTRLEAGYYEELMRVDQFNSQLWEVYMKNPVDVNDWGERGRTIRLRNDFLQKELRPNLDSSLKDQPFSTNRWGMRDRDYEQIPPAGTNRIALMGSSVVLGSGVADGQAFESIIEARLNELQPHGRFEILNFSVGGYGPLEQVVVFEEKVLPFQPRSMIYVAHFNDTRRSVEHLAKVLSRGVPVPYADLLQLAQNAGIRKPVTQAEAERALQPAANDLVLWAYKRLVQTCRSRGIIPVWVFVPALRDRRNDSAEVLVELADRAGFITLDASDIFAGHDETKIRISEADLHPTAEGHRILADGLYTRLRQTDSARSLGLFAADVPPKQ